MAAYLGTLHAYLGPSNMRWLSPQERLRLLTLYVEYDDIDSFTTDEDGTDLSGSVGRRLFIRRP